MKFVRFATLPLVLTSLFMTGCASRTYYALHHHRRPTTATEALPHSSNAPNTKASASVQKLARAMLTTALAIIHSTTATSTTRRATIPQWVPTVHTATPSADPTCAATTSPTIAARRKSKCSQSHLFS